MVAVGQPGHLQLARQLVLLNFFAVAERVPFALNDQRRRVESAQVFDAKLLGLPDRVERLVDRWLFYTSDGDALFSKVRAIMPDAASVWLRGATLEDVFLRLTGRGLLE